MKLNYIGLGWKKKLRKKRASYFLTIDKALITGNVLKKGDDISYYLVDIDGRKGLLMFLDGEGMDKKISGGSY